MIQRKPPCLWAQSIAMVRTCCVTNCKSRGKCEGVSYHSIPTVIRHQGKQTCKLSLRRGTEWIAERNGDLLAIHAFVLCISSQVWAAKWAVSSVINFYIHIEKPSDLYDDTNPDWAPTISMGYEIRQIVLCFWSWAVCFTVMLLQVPGIERYERLQRKKRQRQDDTMEMDEETEMPETAQDSDLDSHNGSEIAQGETSVGCRLAECLQQTDNATTQTDKELAELSLLERKELLQLREDYKKLRESYCQLTQVVDRITLSEDVLKENQQMLKFYTGNYDSIVSQY